MKKRILLAIILVTIMLLGSVIPVQAGKIKPPPEITVSSISYTNYGTYAQVHVTGICWENISPKSISIHFQGQLATDTYDHGISVPKGRDSKYPQNRSALFTLNYGTLAPQFSIGETVVISVLVYDRKYNAYYSDSLTVSWGTGTTWTYTAP